MTCLECKEKEKCKHEKFEVNRHDIPYSYSVACVGCRKTFNSVHVFVNEIRQQSEQCMFADCNEKSEFKFCKKCLDEYANDRKQDGELKGFNEGINTSLRQALKVSKNTQTDCEDCGKSSCGRVDHNIVKKLMIDYIELKSSLENLKTTRNGSG